VKWLTGFLQFNYSPYWSGLTNWTYAESLQQLDLTASPGYPWYYDSPDVKTALARHAGEIEEDVNCVLAGVDVYAPFTTFLKDELRTRKRVQTATTRSVNGASKVHHLVGLQLFGAQNQSLIDTVGKHPVTIGIGVPGPDYVTAQLKFGHCWGYDIKKCDQDFPLPIARAIRDARSSFLASNLSEAVRWFYDQAFCGDTVACGSIHVGEFHKSGGTNTAIDTSLLGDSLNALYVHSVHPDLSFKQVRQGYTLLTNGDDGKVQYALDGCTGPGFREFCKTLGVEIELETDEPRPTGEVTFLSHTLRLRNVDFFGDVVIAAGNYEKLTSSLSWVKRNPMFTRDENALLHAIGLRIVLWPWHWEFEKLEETIDAFLEGKSRGGLIGDILRARIPVSKIFELNVGKEEVLFSSLFDKSVPDSIISAISLVCGQLQLPLSDLNFQSMSNNAKNKISKEEKNRRKEQSKRDKSKPPKQGRSTQASVPPRRVQEGFLVEAKTTLHGAKEVLQAMIDPDHSEPFRLPGGAPTFVNKIRQKTNLMPPPSSSGCMQTNAGMAVLRRDPRLASIIYEYKASGQESNYAIDSSNPSSLNAITLGNYIVPAIGRNVSGWARHDYVMVPVFYKDAIRRLWFQNESANPSQLAFTGLAVTTLYTFEINWLCDGKIVIDIVSGTSDSGGALTITLGANNRTGYMALRPTGGTNTAAQVAISLIDKSKNCFAHKALPGLIVSASDSDNMRVNAASIMLSDRTNAFISQGNCLAYQAGGGEDWTSVLDLKVDTPQSLDPYKLAEVSQKPFTGVYKKGRYLPLKPAANPQEDVMIELFDDGEMTSISPVDMSLQTDYLYVAYNVGELPDGAQPRAEWTLVWDIEGETESQWKDSEIPTTHPDVIKEARYIFSQQVCDFENPSHLSKIWDWVKRNAPKVLRLTDAIIPALPPQYQAPAMFASNTAKGLLAL